jgi:hypothetical protein
LLAIIHAGVATSTMKYENIETSPLPSPANRRRGYLHEADWEKVSTSSLNFPKEVQDTSCRPALGGWECPPKFGGQVVEIAIFGRILVL